VEWWWLKKIVVEQSLFHSSTPKKANGWRKLARTPVGVEKVNAIGG
jgi:hypothetical protein